jgi:D-glycerate 3-kinase
MATIPDDVVNKVLDKVLPFIHTFLKTRQTTQSKKPFILALSGTQGSGKTTWARSLQSVLTYTHGLKTISVSLDDFYFDHPNLLRARSVDRENMLFRTRGHPGTHDEKLAAQFFQNLDTGEGEILVPAFDKSKFNGEGDRAHVQEWMHIAREPPIDVLIFEGWCVGFRPLSDERIEEKWKRAKELSDSILAVYGNEFGLPSCTLQNHSIKHLKRINENLGRYCDTFMGPQNFNYFIHLDAMNLMDIYKWRIEQEHALRATKGMGMTDEQVIKFVEGYMPGYELYLDDLEHVPFFPPDETSKNKGQLKLILDEHRRITNLES